MNGSNVADLVDDSAAAVSYSLSQIDVDHVFDFLWFLAVSEILQLAMLVIIAGLIFGALVTRRWQV